MKTARLLLSVAAMIAFSGSAMATSFAVLLGSGSGDKKAGDAGQDAWIEIGNIAWTSPARQAGATDVATPKPAAPGDKSAARRTFEPVVLTMSAKNMPAALKKAFKKGNKLGAIRLRDGERVLVLHEVVVVDVAKTGEIESVSLSYVKIENAKIPGRALDKLKAGNPGHTPD